MSVCLLEASFHPFKNFDNCAVGGGGEDVGARGRQSDALQIGNVFAGQGQ
jgi:hypothetical protein